MTTGHRTFGPIDSTIQIAPLILTTLITISFLAGVLVMSALTTLRPAQPARAADVATFDAVKFRAEERAPIQPSATFDAVKFRAEERAAIQPSATFDAVKFRAEERTLQP